MISKIIFILSIGITISIVDSNNVFLPVKVSDRKNISEIILTGIGKFGEKRQARPTIPEHLHTGIDIKRPGNNFDNEPIFSIAKGIVISRRDDGPYSELIIAHKLNDLEFWTLYQHISNIRVNVGDMVDTDKQIAGFMSKEELNKYGWQFDHLHLEIIKLKPKRMIPSQKFPQRLYNAYTLICYTGKDLSKYYYSPLDFLKKYMNNR